MCRRKYELKYLEELEPVVKAQALQDGSSYHETIEKFYKEKTNVDWQDGLNPKICAMAWAYVKYIYERNEELRSVEYAEKWFDYPLTKNHSIVGRNDAITVSGTPVEHKTTSSDIDDEYVYALQWDEQILTYMLANNVNEMLYTVVKKPTIRQKQNETDQEFFERCCQWYDEDTEKKVKVIKVTRSQEEIKDHKKNLIVMANEIEGCKHFYRNPSACTCYNRRCEYSQVCLNYNPQLEYVEFEKKKRHADSVEEENLF
jgi:hypothetical protein